jgi:hypothetical protein
MVAGLGASVQESGLTGETYQTAYDSSQVEDAPEPGKIRALLALSWIRDHDCTLRCPQ